MGKGKGAGPGRPRKEIPTKQELLVALLNTTDRAKGIANLADALGVSESTIRRRLNEKDSPSRKTSSRRAVVTEFEAQAECPVNPAEETVVCVPPGEDVVLQAPEEPRKMTREDIIRLYGPASPWLEHLDENGELPGSSIIDERDQVADDDVSMEEVLGVGSQVDGSIPASEETPAEPTPDPAGEHAEEEEEEVKEPKMTLEQRAMLAERSKKYDPTATKQDCIEDLRAVQEDNPDKFITRNFYRIHGEYSEKTWNRYFGTMEEFRSEAGLQLSRSQRHLEKHIAKHASLDESRKFYRLEIEPWVNKYGKYDNYRPDGSMKKVIVASDFHDIDVDLFVLEVFIDTCLVEQPDVIVLNGDIFDLYEFSHFDKDPRKINLRLRMEFVRDRIFKRLREACPDAQIDLIIGNHEHRLLKHMASRTENMAALMELANVGLAELLGLDRHQVNLVSKGNTSAYILKEIREEMAKNFKVYFNCLVCNHTGYEDFGLTTISGHTHRPKMDGEVHLIKGAINKLVTGCMCKLDADYINSKNDWQNSFAIAYVDPVHERVQLQHVMFTEQFTNVNGRFYFRNLDSAEIRCSKQVIDAIKQREIQGFVNRDEEAAIVAGLEVAVA